MMKKDYRDYLNDIFESINDVESFTKSMTFDSFRRDKKTIFAVIRCIEVIGEAAKKVPKSIKDKYPAIPWVKMVGMRNKMIHEYFGVDTNILWQTAREDIPSLKLLVKEIATKFDV